MQTRFVFNAKPSGARRCVPFLLAMAWQASVFTGCASQHPDPGPRLEARYHEVEGQVPARPDPAHPVRIPAELYPDAARRAYVQGSCLVKLFIGVDGTVTDESLSISTGSAMLDRSCLAMYRSARFLPATRNGVPVADYVEMPVNFRIP